MGFEWDKITRWILFVAGLISGAMAGYLFYIGKNSTGAAYMAMTVGFLCFATRTGIFRADKHKNNNINDENKKFREINYITPLFEKPELKKYWPDDTAIK